MGISWYICTILYTILDRSLEVKLPTIWTDEAEEVERVKEEKASEERRSRKNMKVRKKGRNVANYYGFYVYVTSFVASETGNVGSLKRRVWSHLGR